MATTSSVLRGPDRVPDRLLPGFRDHEVEVHVAPDRDRAVPDELPAADLRLEDHPRRPGDHQHRLLRDRPARRRRTRSRSSSTASSPSSSCCSTRGCRSSCLPIFIALENIDRRLLEASTDLGASGCSRFARSRSDRRARHHRRVPVRLHPVDRRVHHAVARRRQRRLHVRPGDRRTSSSAARSTGRRLRALRLPARVVLFLTLSTSGVPPPGRRESRHGRRLSLSPDAASGCSAIFFGLFLVFLYAPTIVLIVFSFNDTVVAALPFEGFTTGWYREAWNEQGVRDAFVASIKVAAGTALIAPGLGLSSPTPSRGAGSAAARPSPRSCSCRSSCRLSCSASRCSSCSGQAAR